MTFKTPGVLSSTHICRFLTDNPIKIPDYRKYIAKNKLNTPIYFLDYKPYWKETKVYNAHTEFVHNSYLFLVNDNISIHKNVIEQKELARLGLLAAQFGQNSFTNQNSPRDQ